VTKQEHSGKQPSNPTRALTDAQRYDLDLNGYLVVRNALSGSARAELLHFWEQKLQSKSYHTLSFNWGQAWQALIDLETVFPIVEDMVGRSARLDHAFCVDQRFGNPNERLHHESGGFDLGCYYTFHKGRMYNGLIGVIYSLFDPCPKSPTFACIPGSHKAEIETPQPYFDLPTSPWSRVVKIEPGDAIIFSEALTHGTHLASADPDDRDVRRAIMMKYTPGHMAFRQPVNSPLQSELARRPGFDHSPIEGAMNLDHLTRRQRAIVAQPAFYLNRPEEV
jgi:ectoine hydroxylase-related dioxygenase (phytanoyl-CoA dioxygenase family)